MPERKKQDKSSKVTNLENAKNMRYKNKGRMYTPQYYIIGSNRLTIQNLYKIIVISSALITCHNDKFDIQKQCLSDELDAGSQSSPFFNRHFLFQLTH